MRLDEKLVHLRKEKGLTQLELAEAVKVSRQAVSKWESGGGMPSTENLRSLSERYGVSVDDLLNESSEKGTESSVDNKDIPNSGSNPVQKGNGLKWPERGPEWHPDICWQVYPPERLESCTGHLRGQQKVFTLCCSTKTFCQITSPAGFCRF